MVTTQQFSLEALLEAAKNALPARSAIRSGKIMLMRWLRTPFKILGDALLRFALKFLLHAASHGRR